MAILNVQTALDNLAIATEAVAALAKALALAEKDLARAQKDLAEARLRDALAAQSAAHKEETARIKAEAKAEVARLKAAHKEELKAAKAARKVAQKSRKAPRQGSKKVTVLEAVPEPATEAEEAFQAPQPEAAPAQAELEAGEVAAFVATVGVGEERAYLFPSEATHILAAMGGRSEGVIPCMSDGAVALLEMLDSAWRLVEGGFPDDFSVELSAHKTILFSIVRAGLSFRTESV